MLYSTLYGINISCQVETADVSNSLFIFESVYSIALTSKRSFFPVIWSAGNHIKGAVYNSRPMPQLKPARLKLSDASPFCPSMLLSAPQSHFQIHCFLDCRGRRMMELYIADLQTIYSHVEFMSYNGKRLTVAVLA